MTSRTTEPERVRQLEADLDRVQDRIDDAERELRLLKTTVNAIAPKSAKVSMGNPCPRCDRSYLLFDHGLLYCPVCPYRLVL
ncbi:hypothetical protein [Halorientalis halophila]|uniref:hypothetical protein n=1 Tax=Halorientalis halophila TaxID=3108499 RepID=UPI003009FCE5